MGAQAPILTPHSMEHKKMSFQDLTTLLLDCPNGEGCNVNNHYMLIVSCAIDLDYIVCEA